LRNAKDAGAVAAPSGAIPMQLDWIKPIKGRKRTLSGPVALFYAATAIFFSLWYLYTSGFGLVSSESNRGIYLMLTSVLVFLLFPARSTSPKTRPSLFDVLWVVAAIISVGYWIDQYVDYAVNRVSDPNQWDLVMGFVGIAVMLETSRRVLGITVVLIAVVFLAQLYFGKYLPGRLAHSGLGVTRIIEFTFSTQQAVFGVVAATFATFVFPFMIFGAFLEGSGAGQFFMELGTSLTGKWRGGPAKIAVVTSALFGSISGSSVANVVSTGTFTIPLMKRIGFKPHHAGAIEAIASTGGQFMPPVMGAGVFILATLTETEYLKIAAMNVIPALLYFIFLIYMVDIEALKSGLKGLDEKEIPRVSTVLMRGWHYLIPLIVVLGLLFMGYSPDFGAFWGTVSAFVLSFRHKESMMGPRKVIDALIGGAHNNNSAGSAIGTLGIIIGGIVLSGLGLKFSAVLIEFAGGNLFLTVVLVTLISIIIGMGSSTTGSYIILAVVAAPALIQLGVPEVPAHLVVFYAACLSNITPPVCVSAYAAAAIAGSDPMRTGFAALKFGVTLVLMPFSFVYAPQLLLYGSTYDIVTCVLGYLIGYLSLAMALQNAEPVRGPIAVWQRAAFAVAALCLLFPTRLWIDLIGLGIFLISWATSIMGKQQRKEQRAQ
jgi:TRAP transporter 4TM/12TM fusion protein